MAARIPLRSTREPNQHDENRVVDLGGQATHVFQFDVPPPLVYDYFTDLPAVFKFLPDVNDVYSYGPNLYRVIVGSSDIFGFNMAGVFDLQAEFQEHRRLRLYPVDGGPPVQLKGFSFPGDLWLEIIFEPDEDHGTIAEYSIEVAMTIPLPGMLRKMPRHFLQQVGERAMEFKMSNMISGFARHIEVDFVRFARWAMASQA